jgi:transposase
MVQKEIGLSEGELVRYRVLERLRAGGLSQGDAARELGLSTRQVRRLLRRLESAGAAGLRSARRGRKPNNWIDAGRREAAEALLRERYRDFGLTLGCQMLAERDGQVFSVETTRTLMREAGLWRAKRRAVRFHPPRARRARLGELVQIDGSPHDWFEGRAPRCTLLVFVDDATSRIQAARFVAAETSVAYLNLVGEYIGRHGLPHAFYSDRHSIFRVNAAESAKSSLTQFGRALAELGIEGICANSPQAKGRVERANGVLQDRLVKLMRLAGIASWEAGNAFLPDFLADYNGRFAQPPGEPEDAHAPNCPPERLYDILCLKETRKLSRQLTCQYHQQWLRILPPKDWERRLIGAAVEIHAHLNGILTICHNGQVLAHELLAARPQAPVVDAKVVQARPAPAKPSAQHPWRKPFSQTAAAARVMAERNSARP